jgi:hypothetical protein
MRREAEFFGDVELELVYIAKKLQEALDLEQLLTLAERDYLVEADNYRGGIIFQTERVGAFFYVRPGEASVMRELLRHHGYKPQEPLGE